MSAKQKTGFLFWFGLSVLVVLWWVSCQTLRQIEKEEQDCRLDQFPCCTMPQYCGTNGEIDVEF